MKKLKWSGDTENPAKAGFFTDYICIELDYISGVLRWHLDLNTAYTQVCERLIQEFGFCSISVFGNMESGPLTISGSGIQIRLMRVGFNECVKI